MATLCRIPAIEEEDEASFQASSFQTPLPDVKRVFSPPILGGYNHSFTTNTGGRRPYRPRNSIDNADVSSYRAPRKGTLEPMREGGQADRIGVYVRLRPISNREKDAGGRCCVRAANRKEIYLTEIAMESDYLRLKRLKGRYFAFDAAFSEETGQEEVYRESTAHLVENVLEGKNSSVFCYGATGAGKTHTMLGTVHNPGVMVLALKDLFLKLKQRSRDSEHCVRLSYIEVYNETVRDLLSPGRSLILREDVKQGIVAAGLTQYQAFSEDEAMALLQQGNQNRTTEPTRLNETSSRSHAILQVVVEHKALVDSCVITRVGKFSLIDLAGSERALATDQRTLRSIEGANINRSLLALSSCINALVEGKKHIPFRNSKLTQLLKDSIGGACQTAMIANISPSNLSFGETQNTLYWADRAKEIQTKACVANEELQVPKSEADNLKLLLEVQKENQQLRMQVALLQQKVFSLENNAVASSPAVQGSVAVCPQTTPLAPQVHCSRRQSYAAEDKSTALNKGFASNRPERETGITTSSHTPKKLASKNLLPVEQVPRTVRMRSPLILMPCPEQNVKILRKTPLPCRDPSIRFHSTLNDQSSSRKRTFWDITNTSSPYTGLSRNTRSNTSTETPSMLLQPGFLRGRPSLH